MTIIDAPSAGEHREHMTDATHSLEAGVTFHDHY